MGLLRRLFGTDETSQEATGISGEATIVSLSEGGPYVNDRPTITMQLNVALPGGERYSAKAKQTVAKPCARCPSKLAAAQRILGAATATETIETALDMVVFREELVAGTRAMLGTEIEAPDSA